MKNKIIVGFLFSFLIPTYLAFAYIPSSFDPGGKNNPFYFQETQDYDTEKRSQNTQTERYLKNTYGISNYYSCSSSASGCGYESDTSDPSVWGSCLMRIQYCLESKAMNESRSNQSFQNQISCPTGTVLKDGACVSNDQACSNKFGQNWKWDGTKNDTGGLNCGCKDGYTSKNGVCVSYDQSCNISYPNTVFNKIDSSGIRICDCKVGYVWNGQGTDCVIIPQKTNDQICQESYGLKSNWDGTKTNDGKLQCDCQSGYQWNQERTQCVTTIEKSNQQLCIEKYDENWDGFRDTEGRLQCACKSGYQFDIKVSKCAIVSVKSSQQICTESYGASSIWTGETNDKNGPICGCEAGYQWNQDRSLCVIIPKHNITTESSLLKKDEKSPEKANQQSSLNSPVSDKVKIGNSSSVFLNKDESITTKDVGTTTIERKIPERKSAWKKIKGFFGF